MSTKLTVTQSGKVTVKEIQTRILSGPQGPAGTGVEAHEAKTAGVHGIFDVNYLKRVSRVSVAAADALGKHYQMADFRCDGQADNETIDEALNEMAVRGGAVELSYDIFSLAASVHMPSKTALIGQGMGITTLQAADLPDDEPGYAGYGVKTMVRGRIAKDVVVRDFSLENIGMAPTVKHQGVSADGGCERWLVERVEAIGLTGPCLRVTNPGYDFTFRGCRVRDTIYKGTGILLDAAAPNAIGAPLSGIKRVLITENWIFNVIPDSAQGGVSIWVGWGGFAEDIWVTKNYVGGSPDRGIGIYHSTSALTSRNLYFLYNRVRDTNRALYFEPRVGSILDLLSAYNNVLDNTTGRYVVGSGGVSTWVERDNKGLSDSIEASIAASSALSLEALIVSGSAIVANDVMPPGQRIPYATTLTTVYARCGTAPSGASLTVAVKRNGTQITTVSIASGQKSGSATGLSIALAAGDVITYDVTAVGSTTAGADLAVQLKGV